VSDETENLPADRGRRDFLKKSLVAGAVLWAAPAVTTLPGGRSWAQTYGAQCTCNGSAYALSVSLLGGPPTIFGQDGSVATVGPIPVPGGGNITATLLEADDTSTVNGTCDAHAEVASLRVTIGTGPTALKVVAKVLFSDAQAGCAPCGTVGASSIASLTVGTTTINVTGACNLDVLGLGLVFVNQQSCSGNTVAVNALRITVPGIADIIVAHAEAGSSNCACATC